MVHCGFPIPHYRLTPQKQAYYRHKELVKSQKAPTVMFGWEITDKNGAEDQSKSTRMTALFEMAFDSAFRNFDHFFLLAGWTRTPP